MPVLKSLSSQDLFEKTRVLVLQERELTLEIISHLEELETRKVYLDFGYSSLFELCVKGLGYSGAQTHRRISAMRVTREIPETKTALEAGKLSLATVALAQGFFSQERKYGERAFSLEEKKEVLKDLQGLSKREAERVLAEKSTLSQDTASHEKPLRDQKTQLELTFTVSQMQKFKKLQALWSHQIPNGDWIQVFEKMADLALEQVDPEAREKRRKLKLEKRELREEKPVSEQGLSPELAHADPAFPPGKVKKQTRYISQKIRDRIWVKAQFQCQYLDPHTQKRCSQTKLLQIDHVLPYAQGGSHEERNLRLLCASHNKALAFQTHGKAQVQKWVAPE